MKKNLIIVLGIVLLGMVSLLCLVATNTDILWDTPTDNAAYKTGSITKSTSAYTIAATYPIFKQTPPGFNEFIHAFMQKLVDEFKEASEENRNGRCVTGGPCTLPQHDFQSDFTVVQANEKYVSAVLRYYGFTGGAHGYHGIVAFNHDLSTNKKITLADIITGPYPYEAASRLSRAVLLKQLSEEVRYPSATLEETEKSRDDEARAWIEEGTKPDARNFTFTFTDDIVTIYFQEYQVGPYVIGQPVVELQRKDLEEAAQKLL